MPRRRRSRIIEVTMLELIIFLLFVSFLYIASASQPDLDPGQDVGGQQGSSDTSNKPEHPNASEGFTLFVGWGSLFVPDPSLSVQVDLPNNGDKRQRTGGRGYDHPPCIKKDGKLAAHFDVIIGPDGIRAQPNAWVQAHAEMMKGIPNWNRLGHDSILNSDNFVDWADPILQYTDREDNAFGGVCRFYAKITYATASEKHELRQRRLTDYVTDYFYAINPGYLKNHFR